MPDYSNYDDLFSDLTDSYRSAYPSRPAGVRRARTYGSASRERSASDVISVSDAVETLRGAVEPLLGGVWIKGEVSNISRPASGHVYFTIKDGEAQIRCVYFLYAARRHPADFRIGDRIEVRGSPDIYSRSGDLQIKLSAWRRAGAGELYEAYLRLKEKLRLEGFFDESFKKRVRPFPKTVVVVTSAQAAALHDVKRTVFRRMPWVRLILSPAYVQGTEAPASLIRALGAADALRADAILLVRGGGSFEDLMAFNDEGLVRYMKTLRTPVIAGIGHESDETLAGLAADVTASTPTAAAEHLGAERTYWEETLRSAEKRLSSDLSRKLDFFSQTLDEQERRLGGFAAALGGREAEAERAMKRIAFLVSGRIASAQMSLQKVDLSKAFESSVSKREERIARCALRLRSPSALFEAKISRLESTGARLHETVCGRVARSERDIGRIRLAICNATQRSLADGTARLSRVRRNLPAPSELLGSFEKDLGTLGKMLDALDPDRPLRAGYVRAERDGIPVTAASAANAGDRLNLVFADGRVVVTVDGNED